MTERERLDALARKGIPIYRSPDERLRQILIDMGHEPGEDIE